MEVIGGNKSAPRDMQRQVSTAAATSDQQLTKSALGLQHGDEERNSPPKTSPSRTK